MIGKVLALLFVVAFVGVGWWALQNISSEDSLSIQVAFGIPHEGTIEMHAVVSMGMSAREAPRIGPNGRLRWDEWVQEHFDLRSVAGLQLPLSMRKSSDIVKPAHVQGTSEGFLFAELQQGVAYQLDYKPWRADSKRYRYSFTAPTTDVKVSRREPMQPL